jgi:hypothetical protein
MRKLGFRFADDADSAPVAASEAPQESEQPEQAKDASLQASDILRGTTTFTNGRAFLPGHPTLDMEALRSKFPTFRALSYNVLAHCNIFDALTYCLPSAALWERRRSMILHEIGVYGAHIVCLQGEGGTGLPLLRAVLRCLKAH